MTISSLRERITTVSHVKPKGRPKHSGILWPSKRKHYKKKKRLVLIKKTQFCPLLKKLDFLLICLYGTCAYRSMIIRKQQRKALNKVKDNAWQQASIITTSQHYTLDRNIILYSDLTWQQATLPVRLGGLGIRRASDMTNAAYLGSCSASKELVCQLLDLNLDSDFRLVDEDMAQHTFISLFTSSSFVFSSISQTILQSTLDDQIYSDILSQYDICDRARLLVLSDPSGLACAWLQVLPSPQLGLAIPPAEFVVALHLWLGIPVFSEMDPSACSCHQLVDCFGDHIIGCSHGPLRIRRHNALCDIIYFALLEDSADVRQ